MEGGLEVAAGGDVRDEDQPRFGERSRILEKDGIADGADKAVETMIARPDQAVAEQSAAAAIEAASLRPKSRA